MKGRLHDFQNSLPDLNLSSDVATTIMDGVKKVCRLGGPTDRKVFPFTSIQPTSSLGDALDFDNERIRTNIRRGYEDALTTLESKHSILKPICDHLRQASMPF